jgi:hypothetical protein
MKSMKNIIIASVLATAASLNAQSFVAGWDFDGANINATSSNANWGDQVGSATASWTHGLANFVSVFENEFGISAQNDSATINNTFTFLATGADSTTGFSAFSQDDLPSTAKQGFQSRTGDDTFTLSFSGNGWESLSLSYATAPTQGGTFTVTTVDLGEFDGLALASYDFTPAASATYDNFAITGTAVPVPEPSAFAAIAGVLAIGFAALRRRR